MCTRPEIFCIYLAFYLIVKNDQISFLINVPIFFKNLLISKSFKFDSLKNNTIRDKSHSENNHILMKKNSSLYDSLLKNRQVFPAQWRDLYLKPERDRVPEA